MNPQQCELMDLQEGYGDIFNPVLPQLNNTPTGPVNPVLMRSTGTQRLWSLTSEDR